MKSTEPHNLQLLSGLMKKVSGFAEEPRNDASFVAAAQKGCSSDRLLFSDDAESMGPWYSSENKGERKHMLPKPLSCRKRSASPKQPFRSAIHMKQIPLRLFIEATHPLRSHRIAWSYRRLQLAALYFNNFATFTVARASSPPAPPWWGEKTCPD